MCFMQICVVQNLLQKTLFRTKPHIWRSDLHMYVKLDHFCNTVACVQHLYIYTYTYIYLYISHICMYYIYLACLNIFFQVIFMFFRENKWLYTF